MGVMGAIALMGCQGAESLEAEPRGELAEQGQALTCTNLIPVMTSNTTPSGTVTSSSVYSADYPAWKAFDSATTFWLSSIGNTPAWLAYEFPGAAQTVKRYAIGYDNGTITTRAPKDWTLDGWNGSAWVTVDARSNQTGWPGNGRREYVVTSPGAYKKYRLNVTDDNDARTGNVVISISRLELIDCQPYPMTSSLWTKTSGASGGFSRIHDLAGDPAGRTYSTGMTSVGLNGATAVGPMDAFLTARDWNGNLLFHKQLGVAGTVTLGYGVARNRAFEEIYVAGWTGGSLDGQPVPTTGTTAFISRYRYTGVFGWTRQIGVAGAQTEGYGVSLDAADNAFLVGATNGGLDGNTVTGQYDAFVVKYDASGVKQWTRQLGVAGKVTHGRRAAADNAGNVYVSGWTTGNLDGNTLTGPQDVFVTKYDANGVKQWTRLAGAPNTGAYLYGSQVDAAGNVYLAGYAGGGMDGVPNVIPQIDVFVARFSPTGTKEWVWELDSGSGSWAMGLYVDTSGIYMTGGGVADITQVTDTSGGKVHNYVAKLNFSGALQWVVQQETAQLNGAAQDVRSMGVVVDDTGNLYVGGYVDGNYQGNTLQGAPDAFLSKIAKPL
ncbi:SBBP repeat-containing protein [Myxococcus sp. K15C18031901]|uniref:SBBP repeat-containing protein n=1 Tax=Myxococcus dinghuensis TaxID=2906761 RepID=UPI0020A6FC8E|nr:SBBP repeat-containing protein [Myxococcus dinghuensis]MCP3104625.1 SBBP repeat-containing protein [Myxococcus dinghuensis]